MDKNAIETLSPKDRERLTKPALRAFWNLACLWALTDHEQIQLLGVSSKATLIRWRLGRVTALRRDTFERLSLAFGIFHALNQLFGPGQTADQWIRLPNRAPPFDGRPAIDLMLSGRVEDLYATRNYLDGVLSGWLG